MIEPGAFNGLAALTTLNIGFNSLPSLPAGTFDGLVDIETMYVCDTCFLSHFSLLLNAAFSKATPNLPVWMLPPLQD